MIAGVITPQGAFVRTRMAVRLEEGVGMRLYRYRQGRGLYFFDGSQVHRIAENAAFTPDRDLQEVRDVA